MTDALLALTPPPAAVQELSDACRNPQGDVDRLATMLTDDVVHIPTAVPIITRRDARCAAPTRRRGCS